MEIKKTRLLTWTRKSCTLVRNWSGYNRVLSQWEFLDDTFLCVVFPHIEISILEQCHNKMVIIRKIAYSIDFRRKILEIKEDEN